jgi:hypothetical protein
VVKYPESRCGMRFPVEARVTFNWIDETGRTRDGEGRTLNISERGAFVLASMYPPIGTPVKVQVFLPKISISPMMGTVQIDGRVVRSQSQFIDGRTETGFAIEGQSKQTSAVQEFRYTSTKPPNSSPCSGV